MTQEKAKAGPQILYYNYPKHVSTVWQLGNLPDLSGRTLAAPIPLPHQSHPDRQNTSVGISSQFILYSEMGHMCQETNTNPPGTGTS